MKYPLLLPTLGHGSTDIFDTPKLTLISHSIGFISIKFLPIFYKKFLLISCSIIHIKRDMPLVLSCLMHTIWLKYPIISKLYLSFFHTPLHYIRAYYQTPKKFFKKLFLGISSSLIISYGLHKNYDILIEKYIDPLWWIAPVISHIFISEFLIFQKYSVIKRNLAIPIKVITLA